MKRLLLNIFCALACILLASCTEKYKAVEGTMGKVVLTDPADGILQFDILDSAQTLSFKAPAPWRAQFVNSGASAWCSIEPADGDSGENTIKVSVTENKMPQKRSAAFNIISGESQQKVLVSQNAIEVEVEVPDSIRVLAIGNSYSDDAMWYLYDLLKQAGYEYVKLGNLYIGSCTLQTHAQNIATGAKAYTYRVNQDGRWIDNNSYSSVEAIGSDEWDIITMQQASGSSGIQDTYQPYLGTIVSKVRDLCPEAMLFWHMTWAYQGDSTHPEFYKYSNDQMTMYNAIVSAVKSKILTDSDFAGVIPSGTAIQNLRTSQYGDNLTRDGFHMSYDVGRLATAMMWLKSLTECDLDTISWTPSQYTYTDYQLAAIREAVENAYAEPYKVTNALYVGKNVYLCARNKQ